MSKRAASASSVPRKKRAKRTWPDGDVRHGFTFSVATNRWKCQRCDQSLTVASQGLKSHADSKHPIDNLPSIAYAESDAEKADDEKPDDDVDMGPPAGHSAIVAAAVAIALAADDEFAHSSDEDDEIDLPDDEPMSVHARDAVNLSCTHVHVRIARVSVSS